MVEKIGNDQTAAVSRTQDFWLPLARWTALPLSRYGGRLVRREGSREFVIQLSLVSGPTSWKWAPLWAPTSIASRLSNHLSNVGFSSNNGGSVNCLDRAALRVTAACPAKGSRSHQAGCRSDTLLPRRASSDRKFHRLDRCNSPTEQAAPE